MASAPPGPVAPRVGHDRRPDPGSGDGAGLETILEEIETVVDPVAESVSMAPAVGIAVAGGPMITLPEEGDPVDQAKGDSVRSGLTQAGPVAIAGLVVNGAAALVVVAVARLVSSAVLRRDRPAARAVLHPVHARARPSWSAWSAGSPPCRTPAGAT